MKKRLITLGVVITLLIATASYIMINKTGPSSVALGRTYETVEEIVENSHIIVTCNVTGHDEETIINYDGIKFKGFQQKIKIHNVLFNEKDIELNKNDMLLITDINEKFHNDSWLPLIEHFKIKPGKYVLFLNTLEDPETGEVYCMTNSLNNLYKLKGKEFKILKEKDVFKNQLSAALSHITGEDIVKAIKNKR